MRSLDRVSELRENLRGVAERQGSELLRDVVEIQPDEQLHHQVRTPGGRVDAGGDDLDDVIAVICPPMRDSRTNRSRAPASAPSSFDKTLRARRRPCSSARR